MSVELLIPDIGDFKDVAVVDVLVKAGDAIELETPLVTLETDKATMDVPATAAGTITEVLVKRGDKVSKGALIARLEPTVAPVATPAQSAAPAPPAAAPAKSAAAPAEGAGDTVRMPLRRPRAVRAPARASRARCSCWCSAPVPAAIPPPSAPRTWG